MFRLELCFLDDVQSGQGAANRAIGDQQKTMGAMTRLGGFGHGAKGVVFPIYQGWGDNIIAQIVGDMDSSVNSFHDSQSYSIPHFIAIYILDTLIITLFPPTYDLGGAIGYLTIQH